MKSRRIRQLRTAILAVACIAMAASPLSAVTTGGCNPCCSCYCQGVDRCGCLTNCGGESCTCCCVVNTKTCKFTGCCRCKVQNCCHKSECYKNVCFFKNSCYHCSSSCYTCDPCGNCCYSACGSCQGS